MGTGSVENGHAQAAQARETAREGGRGLPGEAVLMIAVKVVVHMVCYLLFVDTFQTSNRVVSVENVIWMLLSS